MNEPIARVISDQLTDVERCRIFDDGNARRGMDNLALSLLSDF